MIKEICFIIVFITAVLVFLWWATSIPSHSAKNQKTIPEHSFVKKTRVPISNKLKHEVWRRDDFTCQYCERDINIVELEIDHIKPVSKGGTNAMSNLQTLCFECNRSKRDK